MLWLQQETPNVVDIPQVHETEPAKEQMPSILTKAQVPVDEQHPVVIELAGLGYTLEECIEAAEKFPEDAIAAQEYLMEIGEKGELFKGSLKNSNTSHADNIVSSTKFGLEQQESSESRTYDERCVNCQIVFGKLTS